MSIRIRKNDNIGKYNYLLLRQNHTTMTLGIDIGGTNICFGLVENGHVLRAVSVRSFEPEATLEQTLDHLKKQIDLIITPEVKSIGFGVPSVVDEKNGIVYDTANIPSWKEVHLKSIFEDRYSRPVYVNNDSNCYALGSYLTMEESSRPESLVAVTLGTGVGMGVVVDGCLYSGVNCGVGELACLPYKDATVEDYTSKKFFLNQGIESIEAGIAAKAGDPAALRLFEEYGRNLGYALSMVLYAYDPEVIVLGGGVGNNYPFFHDSMISYLKETFPYHKTIENLNIKIATEPLIPVIGAASLTK